MDEGTIFKATVPTAKAGVRLDIFLTEAVEGLSRKRAKKLIDGRAASVNGRIDAMASRILKAQDRVELHLEGAQPPKKIQKIGIVAEDEYFIAADKPAGLVSGPTKDKSRPHAERLVQESTKGRVTLLHRLDRDTSGVLLLGKNKEFSAPLLEAFKKREISKTYLAIVSGSTPESFIDVCHLKEGKNSRVIVVRAGGMRAETSFRTLATTKTWSLVEATPKTGRMHQIRVSLKRQGNPIVGDALYGGVPKVRRKGDDIPVPRHMLHAWKLSFLHPITKKQLELVSPVPEDFKTIAETLFGPLEFSGV
jgi:RluA family pseudouridine synthase